MKFNPEDPKWTAYVLNELAADQRAAIENEMAANPEAKKLVEEIRESTAWLSASLTQETEIELRHNQRSVIREHAGSVSAGHVIRFPLWRFAGIGAAAAALVVAVVGVRMHKQAGIADKDIPIRNGSVVAAPAQTQPVDVAVEEADLVTDERLDNAVVAENEPVSSVATPAQNAAAAAPQKRPTYAERVRMRLAGGSADIAALPKSVSEVGLASPSSGVRREMNGYALMAMPEAAPPAQYGPSLDDYAEIRDNTFQRVIDHPLSTFSIDVDTASYSQLRSYLMSGNLPPKDAVRIEEMVNYFPYDYAAPEDGTPFASNMEVGPCPWNAEHYLVRVALKGREIQAASRPACNLVYLLDVSGSMSDANKLPLVKRAMQMLVRQLDARDHVAIVVYAGAAGLVLPATRGDNGQAILDAIERLQAGGSTDGGSGIELAYKVAAENFEKSSVNRVILCTDGDFNVGMTQRGDLVRMIEEKAKSGIYLTVLGFGMGNYKDSTLEELSNKGNGNYAYIDTFNEARKVFVDQMTGTLVTIAKDVKIQVEFNPAYVAEYRLIGYENRMLKKEDFNNDKVDAGEIGAGHTVTAFYEIVPSGKSSSDVPPVDALKYQVKTTADAGAGNGEILTLKLRYKMPDANESTLQSFPLAARALEAMDPSQDFRFASSVASFGMLLRDSEFKGGVTYDDVIQRASTSLGEDKYGYRKEFLDLVRNAAAIAGQRPGE